MQHRYLLFASLLTLLSTPLLPATAQGQARGTITGRITEAQGGAPLPGANIVVEGTTIGGSADHHGRFRLRNVPAGSQTLVASFVGFERAEVSIQVEAGATIEQHITLESQTLQSGEIVVTGIRKGEVRAINQKKQAANIVEVLSADEIGKLPDQNVAEAIQRLPGIVLQTSRGEGRFVSIRGSQASLNNVTLNGQSMASTAESRATALDLVPAEMVSDVEVTKAITPDMDGNSIGGTVNINTMTALDRSRPFLFGSIEGLQHDQQVQFRDQKLPFRGSLTAGTQFGADDQFGIVVSGNVSRRDFTVTEFAPDSWELVTDYLADGETSDPMPEGTLLPEETQTLTEDNERTRYGVTANLDYRPSDQTSLFARGSYTHTDEVQSSTEYAYKYYTGDLTPLTATSGRFGSGTAQIQMGDSDESEDLWSLSLGGEHVFGALTWNLEGTYTRGTLDHTFDQAKFVAGGTEMASTVDFSEPIAEIFPVNPTYASDPSNYTFNQLERESEQNTENTYVASTDLRWDTRLGAYNGLLKTGAKVRVRDKVIDDAEPKFRSGPASIPFTDYAETIPPLTIQGGSRQFVTGDVSDFTSFFEENQNNEEYFSEDVGVGMTEHVENDSDNREGVYAGYAMGSILLGDLQVLGGVRVEHTRTETKRFQLIENEDSDAPPTIGSETFNTDYTNVLPSVHLKYTATDDLIFRGAWSNTIGRADYEQLAAFREVEISIVQDFEDPDAPDRFQAFVDKGNPNLQPYKAMNFDVFAEYYFQPGALLSVGGFYKHIENPIYTFSENEHDVENPFGEGRLFDLVSTSQLRNADRGTIRGLEATYRQPLTFLPAPLDGLGIISDVAMISSEAEVPGREEEVPFFDQSDLVYNITPYYQKGGLEVRVAFHFQSEYLGGLSGNPALDTYVDDYNTVDLKGSYDFGPLLPGSPELSVEVDNLSNEPEISYKGTPERLDSHVLTGRTVEVGLSVDF